MIKELAFQCRYLKARVFNVKRPRTTAVLDSAATDNVFDRLPDQIAAVHELRVWRAARRVALNPQGCPPFPRIARKLLTADEQEHVRTCRYCMDALEHVPHSPPGFESLEYWWQTFKQTRSSLTVRLVQAVVLLLLMSIVYYPSILLIKWDPFGSTEPEAKPPTAYYTEQLGVMATDRNALAETVQELKSSVYTLDNAGKQREIELKRLQNRLSLANQELAKLRTTSRNLQLRSDLIVQALRDRGLDIDISSRATNQVVVRVRPVLTQHREIARGRSDITNRIGGLNARNNHSSQLNCYPGR